MRDAKELLIASKAFACENRWRSWWHLASTLGVWTSLSAIAVSNLSLGIRTVSSIVAALVLVRLFIIYHDYQHGAILQNSPLARLLMTIFGLVTLNPPSVWTRSHDHHHKHNSKTFGASIGSYPIMTTHAYAIASAREKFTYAASRHPLTMLFGYFTVFLWGMCLRPFFRSPTKHVDVVCSLVVHFSLLVYLGTWGMDVVLLGMIIPLFVASFVGAYLFYAQHNYPAARLQSRADWSHVDAALHSSSFLVMGPVMNWFTGNIGYHHVHHLNARIPFYRLPEAMASLEELQSIGSTTLSLGDIVACLRLKLWSPEADQFVGFEGA